MTDRQDRQKPKNVRPGDLYEWIWMDHHEIFLVLEEDCETLRQSWRVLVFNDIDLTEPYVDFEWTDDILDGDEDSCYKLLSRLTDD